MSDQANKGTDTKEEEMSKFEKTKELCLATMQACQPEGSEGRVFLSGFSMELPQENVAPMVAAMLERGMVNVTIEPCYPENGDPTLDYFDVEGKAPEEEEDEDV